MLAHGFTSAMLDALVRDGLATAERRGKLLDRPRIAPGRGWVHASINGLASGLGTVRPLAAHLVAESCLVTNFRPGGNEPSRSCL